MLILGSFISTITMDSLTSLAHTTNSRHQLHQQEGEDEFDEIVPMQLDQPPPARPPPPPVVAERSVSFFTADSSNGGQGQPTSIGQQQMQSFFPNCARPPAASSIPPQQQQQHLLQPLLPHHQQQSQQFPHHPQQQQTYPQQFGHHSPLGSRGHQMVEQHFGHPQQQQQPHGMNGGLPSFGGQQPPAFGHQQQHRGWPPPQQQHHQHHHQQQQHWQMPPTRKESMPALHFNDQPFHPTNLGGGTQEPNDINSHHDSHHHRLLEQQRTERTRSYSTAMLFCCTPSPSSMQFPHAPGNHHFHHSPGTTAATMAAGGGGAEQQDYRRTKSTVLPPTSVPGWCPSSKNSTSGDFGAGGGAGGNGAAIVHSLRRFHSQLRSPCRSLLGTAATPGILPPLKPYTPPPILSPMRQGSGLFNRILTQRERKQSSLAFENNINSGNTLLDEDRRMIIKEEEGTNNCAAGVAGGMAEEMAADDEAEGNTNHQNHLHNGTTNGTPNGGGHIDDGFDHEANGADLSPTERPQRKNGTILFAADGASGSGLSLAAELEQLRKQSSASYRSRKASMFGGGRMSILHGKLSVANDDFLRKISSISMDEQEEGGGGGGAAVGGAAEKPPESDSIPHINLGKNYQARVKKWADRAISTEERAAIPDRDEQVFCAHSVEHIPQPALSAYETLACSVALPKPGRNKELALHILAENQGNLQAAVMDLLRCDTLDWEQYQSVYNSRYVDVDAWSPEEISSFQDAIYKSEKDFQQVASELGNRTVHECVAFYYTWKKACPDDYRKLRNLRRKRQLLEQQLDMNSFDRLQPTQSEKSKEGGPSSEEDDEEEEDFSETESDITNPSLLSGSLHPQPMECSPGQQRKHSMPAPQLDPLGALLGPAAAAAQQVQGQQQMFNGNANTGYPWLHGTDGIFPSPSSSSTSTNNNDNNGSGGGGHFAGALALECHGSEGGENGHHNGGQPFVAKIRHHHGHGHHAHGAGAKKGAQPQADGFFHCRLCEKRFEKVKSLNAHMKSHAMKARAEAEAQQKHQHNNHSSNNNNHQSHHQPTHQQNQQQQLIFPVPTKKQPVDDVNPLSALTTPLGMPGLGNAQAAMAALSSLGRQIQQQQQQQGQAGQAAFAAANSAGFGLLRNMLQYGHQHAAAATAAPGTAGTQSGAGWPPGLEQHFNA